MGHTVLGGRTARGNLDRSGSLAALCLVAACGGRPGALPPPPVPPLPAVLSSAELAPPDPCGALDAEVSPCPRGVSVADPFTCVWSDWAVTCWSSGERPVGASERIGRYRMPPGEAVRDFYRRCRAREAGPFCELARLLGDGLARGPAPEGELPARGCVVDKAGAVHCAGPSGAGLQGDGGAPTHGPTQAHRAALPPARSVSAGGKHACAVTQDGEIFCWGLRQGFPPGQPRFPHEGQARQRAQGRSGELCVLLAGGEVHCRAASATVMYRQPGLGPVVELTDGDSAGVCARSEAGEVSCWTPETPPRPVDGLVAARLVDGASCALDRDGDVACWGSGEILWARKVAGLGKVKQAFSTDLSGQGHEGPSACALNERGEIRCWGVVEKRWEYRGKRRMQPDDELVNVSRKTPVVIPGGTGVDEVISGCVRRGDGTIALLRAVCDGRVCPLRVETPRPAVRVERLVSQYQCSGVLADGRQISLSGMMTRGTGPAPRLPMEVAYVGPEPPVEPPADPFAAGTPTPQRVFAP